MATKLMQSQNLTQADMIANESAEERSTRAGQSTVTISSQKGTMVKNQRWYSVASTAACEAFDVQSYSESYDDKLDWVFYGLADVHIPLRYHTYMLMHFFRTPLLLL